MLPAEAAAQPAGRAERLAARRRRLVAQSQALRTELTLQLKPLSQSLATVDSGMRIFTRIRQHPEWIAGALIALVLLRPSRVARGVRGALLGLRTWRRLAPLVPLVRQLLVR
jgi:hypothetical protein